ncbi:MAG: hypothetical protein EBS65_23175, partial [Betaproteobacteria bacterium]|nr:hypothetical protein [Betaproteobacteria bacterium]
MRWTSPLVALAFIGLTTEISVPLSAQSSGSAARPDTVISVARAPRVQYVPKSSRADTLRGSYTTPSRTWWDVTFYDLHVQVNPADSSVAGYNAITYKVLSPARELQVDLMEPLVVDSMRQDGKAVTYRREGAAFFAALPSAPTAGTQKTITVYYHGKPQVARNPPWQGGFTWTTDSLGRPWIVTTDQ